MAHRSRPRGIWRPRGDFPGLVSRALDPLQPEPPGHQRELLASRRASPAARRARGGLCGPSGRPRAVGLEVDARDQRLAEQEGQDVVAVHALWRRGVDLDPVAEAEQALGRGRVPDQRVERGEQGLRPDAARAAGGGERKAGSGASPRPRPAESPASTSSAIARLASSPGGGNSRAGRRRSRRRGAGGDPESARWASASAGVGSVQDRPRDHPLGQVVDPLEVAPGGGVIRPARTAIRAHAWRRLHSHQPGRLGPCSSSDAAIGPWSPTARGPASARAARAEPRIAPARRASRAVHPPAQQGVQRERQQRGLVAPVFEEPARRVLARRGRAGRGRTGRAGRRAADNGRGRGR